MPVVKVYTKSQWDEFARSLDALQEKPESERGVTVRDAMKDMRTHIRSAQTKGYMLEQIAKQAKRAGIDITASTLKYGMRSAGKGNTACQTTKAPASRAVCDRPNSRACCHHRQHVPAALEYFRWMERKTTNVSLSKRSLDLSGASQATVLFGAERARIPFVYENMARRTRRWIGTHLIG